MTPRILILSEFSKLSTGYATYCRELLKGLHDYGLDIRELASYADPLKEETYMQPWKVYPVLPNKQNQEEVRIYDSNQLNIFGLWKFDHVCLDYKPTQVIGIRDYWFEYWIDYSPFRNKFHWSWLITADAECNHSEWLDTYSRTDSLLTYNDWAKIQIPLETNNNLSIVDSVPPKVSDSLYQEPSKHIYGLQDKIIFGTVMRNQKRKLYADLFESFRKFLDQSQRNDVLLYCHTSYPDQMCWDIPQLLMQYRLSSKVLFSYICRECNTYFPSFFNDAVCTCLKCGNIRAGLINTKNGLNLDDMRKVYNLFDLYIQYANAEGFGISQAEAAACSIPIMSVDYSAMKDIVRKLNGIPIKTIKLNKEIETGRLMAIPDNNHLVEEMLYFISMPEQLRKIKGIQTKKGFDEHYSWDKTINKWINHITNIRHDKYDQLWSSPCKLKNTNKEIPQNLSNRDYVRWLIINILQDESKLDSYFELKMLRQLNYGIVTHNFKDNFMDMSFGDKNNMKPFTREDLYNYMIHLVNIYNKFEGMRINA